MIECRSSEIHPLVITNELEIEAVSGLRNIADIGITYLSADRLKWLAKKIGFVIDEEFVQVFVLARLVGGDRDLRT